MISCEDVYVCVYKNHVENIGIFCHEICVVRDDSRYNMLESFDFFFSMRTAYHLLDLQV